MYNVCLHCINYYLLRMNMQWYFLFARACIAFVLVLRSLFGFHFWCSLFLREGRTNRERARGIFWITGLDRCADFSGNNVEPYRFPYDLYNSQIEDVIWCQFAGFFLETPWTRNPPRWLRQAHIPEFQPCHLEAINLHPLNVLYFTFRGQFDRSVFVHLGIQIIFSAW